MLKLNYTEIGLYMERISTSLEMAIAQRIVLSLRLGQSLTIEPGRASFLLPGNLPELEQLTAVLQHEHDSTVTVMSLGDGFVELSLSGSWIAESKEAHEGMFLAVMGDFSSPCGAEPLGERVESLIYKLWQMSAAQVSSFV
jgi:hypothetical protein